MSGLLIAALLLLVCAALLAIAEWQRDEHRHAEHDARRRIRRELRQIEQRTPSEGGHQ